MRHVVAPRVTHVWVLLKATAAARVDGAARHRHTVELDASQASETVAATPDQDLPPARFLQRHHRQRHRQHHLDLLYNA